MRSESGPAPAPGGESSGDAAPPEAGGAGLSSGDGFRRLHPATLLFDAIRVGRGFIIPAIVGGASAGDDVGEAIQWVLLILAVPALVIAVGKYLTYRFRVDQGAGELVIDSGVLSRRHRVIPLDRVQNIEVRQSGLQRAFGVAELRVETARLSRGSAEAELSVLSAADARTLQAVLRRSRAGAAGAGPASADEPEGRLLAALSPRDLVVGGATANEAGLIAAGLAGLLQLANDLPFTIPVPQVDPTGVVEQVSVGAASAAILALVLAVVLIGWLLSIGHTVVRYFGFRLERVGDDLRKEYGLIGREHGTVPLRRVQAVRVEETVLRRWFGLAALKIETAGGIAQQGGGRGGAEAYVPIVRAHEVAGLVAAVFEDVDYDALGLRSVHPLARRRAFIRMAAPVALAAAALAWLVATAWLALLALVPAAYLLAARHYAHLGYATLPGYVVARAGVMNRVTWIVPERKIQTVHTRATPFQRRQGLATVIIDTAAGGSGSEARVIDLGSDGAARLLDRLADAAGRTPAPGPTPALDSGRATC